MINPQDAIYYCVYLELVECRSLIEGLIDRTKTNKDIENAGNTFLVSLDVLIALIHDALSEDLQT